MIKPRLHACMNRRRVRMMRRSSHCRGAVLVLALLGAFMMAGMIGYVFNAGRHAQVRQQTQHAADASVISGAGYVARSFNTVAMNNVEMSRLIAVVQLLDAVPLSVEYTERDVFATFERVDEQLRKGTGDALGDQTLGDISRELDGQLNQLEQMNLFFNGLQRDRSSGKVRQLAPEYDVRKLTFYEVGQAPPDPHHSGSSDGRGELWKAMESLDAISQATMEHLSELTQVTAIETGLRNMRGEGGETLAAMAPFDDGILWERYRFDDFRDPVVRGRLPRWVDDEVTNRGPYDAVFGWRSTRRESIEIPNPNYTSQSRTNTKKRAGSRWSGGTGRGGRVPRTISIGSRLVGYTTYGTWQWLGDIIRNRIDRKDVLYNSQFVTRVNRMGGNKLNYLWPGSAMEWVFLDPQWVTDYDEAERIINAGTPRVAYTQFVRMDYEQRFLNGQPVNNETMKDWSILRPRGGWAHVPGATKKRDHVWEDNASIEWTTTRNVTGPNGQTQQITDTHEIKYRWLYVWAGINVGPPITIRDPNNFASREDLPSPIDFDHDAMTRPPDDAPGQPGSPFTFLAVAKQPNQAQMWHELFDTSAYDGHAAIAQASVFNNHSWDLWTQMWHAQLEPVQQYDQWIDLIRSQIGSASGYKGLSTGELSETLDYLESIEALAPLMLNH